MRLSSLVPYTLSWLATSGGVWGLFSIAEDALKPEARRAISRWLRNLDSTSAFANWPASFATLFDRIFGERHLSARCFWRSCAASFASVVVITTLWMAVRPHQFARFIQNSNYIFLMLIFVSACALNLIPDYLSLLETRYFIRFMSRTHSLTRIAAFLFLGLVISAVIISIAFLYWGMPFVYRPGHPVFESFLGMLSHLITLSSVSEGIPSFGICFYSTFSTSVWLWLYALSTLLVRAERHLGLGLRRFRSIIDIDKKPVRCVGFVAVVLVTLVYLMAAPFVL